MNRYKLIEKFQIKNYCVKIFYDSDYHSPLNGRRCGYLIKNQLNEILDIFIGVYSINQCYGYAIDKANSL